MNIIPKNLGVSLISKNVNTQFRKKHSIIRLGTMVLLLTMVLFVLGVLIARYYKQPEIEIISYLVRDRVIPLDEIVVKSVMIVGFRFPLRIRPLSNMRVQGELYFNSQLISQDDLSHPDPRGGNLGFQFSLFEGPVDKDRPFTLPDGTFRIVIQLVDENGATFARVERKLNSNQLSRRFDGFERTYHRPEYVEILETASLLDDHDANRHASLFGKSDYLVFQKNYLERVYPYTTANPAEMVSAIRVEASREEFKPITFSIRALKNLGKVRVNASTLSGPSGMLAADCLRVGIVEQLTETVEEKKNGKIVNYRWAPKIIHPGEVTIHGGHTQRYWLTLKVPSNVRPGEYKGIVSINPEFSHQTDIPIIVTVLPFRLTDTDIQYGMMMTYEFYELDDEKWTDEEQTMIGRNGLAICKDLREHGMTIMYPHAHFYYQAGKDGQPLLRSLEASLDAYAALAFPGPFCWYIGHLVQTSKVFHPGSILNYDEDLAKTRLRSLLESYAQMAQARNIPNYKLIVQTVDEPDRQDRIAAGKTLNQIARDMGFKTLITRKWPEVDIICTGPPGSDDKAKQIRDLAKMWWIYPNDALMTKNRAYTRYVFGFGAWRWGVDGVVPWTFQVTQGCNGNPFTVLDGDEVMVAYPGVDSPLATPLWESIRDGINDYKYIYQLKLLIESGKEMGDEKAVEIEQQLNQFKNNLGEGPLAEDERYGDWPSGAFDKMRRQIVNWTLELHSRLGLDEFTSG